MKHKQIKPKKGTWFIALRGSYIPISWQGWLTYIPFVGYLLYSVNIGVRNTNSHTAAVLFVVPNWVAAAIVMTWLAKYKS